MQSLQTRLTENGRGKPRLLVGCAVLLVGIVCWLTFWPRTRMRHLQLDKEPQWLRQRPKRYAYSFYATDEVYLCNALTAAANLRQLGTTADILFLVDATWSATDDPAIEHMLRTVAPQYNVSLRYVPLWSAQSGDATWLLSLTKLHALELIDYDRVIALDSDIWLRQSVDHLFTDWPHIQLAMPNAYWLDNELTSLMILVDPDLLLREEVEAVVQSDNGFDMEILNGLINQGSAAVLPTRPYYMLSGELNANNDHSRFLGEPSAVWNASTAYIETHVFHFSDWPLPKPWIASDEEIDDKAAEHCGSDDEGCDEGRLWRSLYDDFRSARYRVCNLR